MLEDPDIAAAAVAFYHAALHEGEYVLGRQSPSPISFRDLFCQTYGGPCDVLCGGYVMMQIDAIKDAGVGGWAHVPLGHTPASDHSHELNDAVLAMLPDSLHARTWFGTADSDGRIDIIGPTGVPFLDQRCPSLPLEVGYGDPRTIFLHLRRHGGFVRWPYGSESLSIFCLDAEYFREVLAQDHGAEGAADRRVSSVAGVG